MLPAGAWLVTVTLPAIAMAQGGGAGIKAAEAAKEPNYVAPYFLMVLSIGLGLLVVGRPSRRKDPSEKDGAAT